MKERKQETQLTQDELFMKFLEEHSDDFAKGTREMIEKTKRYVPGDSKFWELKLDPKDGIGYALIRFMPTKNFDLKKVNENYVLYKRHYFQKSNGAWYVNWCPRTIGENCPVCEEITPLWKGSDNDYLEAQLKGPKKYYYTNILILKYPLEPEYEGKVVQWKIPFEVFQKIMDRVPKADEKECVEVGGLLKFDPFNPFKSALFKLRGVAPDKKGKGSAKKPKIEYTTSEFYPTIEKMNSDDFKKAYAMCIDLQELKKWPEFRIKSYDELKADYLDTENKTDFNVDEIKKSIQNVEDENKNENSPDVEEIEDDKAIEEILSGDETVKESTNEDFDIDKLSDLFK
jgi:hypothetical protein